MSTLQELRQHLDPLASAAKDKQHKPPRGAQPGNRNAAKHPESTVRTSARLPASLVEWAREQPGGLTATLTRALKALRDAG